MIHTRKVAVIFASIVVFCIVSIFRTDSALRARADGDAVSLSGVNGMEEISRVKIEGWNPVFSPSGRYLAFRAGWTFSPPAIGLLDTDTWQVRRIESDDDIDDYSIRWLDESYIAFSADGQLRFAEPATCNMVKDSSAVSLLNKTLVNGFSVSYEPESEVLSVYRSGIVSGEFSEVREVERLIESSTGKYIGVKGVIADSTSASSGKATDRHALYVLEPTSGNIMEIHYGISREFAFSIDDRYLLFSQVEYHHPPNTNESEHWGSLWLMDLESKSKKMIVEPVPCKIVNLTWSSSGMICFSRDCTPEDMGFYRLQFAE